MINSRDSEKMHMTSIQTIANSLLEVVEVRTRDKRAHTCTSLILLWFVAFTVVRIRVFSFRDQCVQYLVVSIKMCP